MSEIDKTPSGLDTIDLTQEVLESVVRKRDDRVPTMVEICLLKIVERYLPNAIYRYLDEHLLTKLHQLVSESFLQLHRIGKSSIVSHAD